MANQFRTRAKLKRFERRIAASEQENIYQDLAAKRLEAAVAGGYMLAATYDAAGIAQQVVGTTQAQTVTNKTIVLPSYAVSSLPEAVVGQIAIATDANATTQNSIVAGSGSNTVLVFYDGTNWRIA